MGSIDKTIRILFAVVVAVLFYTKTVEVTLALVLGILATIMLATSLISFCPLYLPFGLSTRKKNDFQT